jgi:hypothetical protein
MMISDWINSVLAFATVLMACGTLYLAHLTHRLADETAKATRQAARHHEEGLREAQQREATAQDYLWESIATLSQNCLEAMDGLLKNYPAQPTSDIMGHFLRSHAAGDFDIPLEGLAAVPLHQVGDPVLITLVLRLRGIMGRITKHLDEVRASRGVMPFSRDLVAGQGTPAFNAVAGILRIVHGHGAEEEIRKLPSLT